MGAEFFEISLPVSFLERPYHDIHSRINISSKRLLEH